MTHPKRPRDPNQLAKSIIDIATGQKPDRHPTSLTVNVAFTAMTKMVPHFEPEMIKTVRWFV